MKVASIVPVPYLYATKGGDYFMCLAHLAKQDEDYRTFFKERAAEGKFVIMDNGAAEDAQLDTLELVELALGMNVSEVVLPDTLFDSEETLLKSYKGKAVFTSNGYTGRFMGVPQGNNYNEWQHCAEGLRRLGVDTIGISKFISLRFGNEARIAAMGLLKTNLLLKGIDVHLLGCAYSPLEIAILNTLMPVRGTDSALAYVFAREGWNLAQAINCGHQRDQTEIDFFDEDTDPRLIEQNIKVWEGACNERVFKLLV